MLKPLNSQRSVSSAQLIEAYQRSENFNGAVHADIELNSLHGLRHLNASDEELVKLLTTQ